MKLHLPTFLRSALVACACSVAAISGQALADSYTVNVADDSETLTTTTAGMKDSALTSTDTFTKEGNGELIVNNLLLQAAESITVAQGTLTVTQPAASNNGFNKNDIYVSSGATLNLDANCPLGWSGDVTDLVQLTGAEGEGSTATLVFGNYGTGNRTNIIHVLPTTLELRGYTSVKGDTSNASQIPYIIAYKEAVTIKTSSAVEGQASTHNEISTNIATGREAAKTITFDVAGANDTLDITGYVFAELGQSAAGGFIKNGAGKLTFGAISSDAKTPSYVAEGYLDVIGTFTVNAGEVAINRNMTVNAVTLANNNTTKVLSVGSGSTLTLGGGDNSAITNSVGTVKNAEGATAALTAVKIDNSSIQAVDTTAAISNAAIDVTSGQFGIKNVTLDNSTVTVQKNAILKSSTKDDNAVFNNSTIVVYTGTDGTRKDVTIETRDGSSQALKMTNYYIQTQNADDANKVGADLRGISGAVSVENAQLTVDGKLYLLKANFTDSIVTIKSGASIVQASTSNTNVTFDDLTIEAGGVLSAGNGSNYIFTGDTALTLAELEGTGTDFTTTALCGKMADSAVLTLDFTNALLGTGGKLDGLDSFSITFTNLSALTGDVLTDNNFAYNAKGWDVSVEDAAASSLKLTFTSGAAIPEPATATLSLLALAGLAARRRRK